MTRIDLKKNKRKYIYLRLLFYSRSQVKIVFKSRESYLVSRSFCRIDEPSREYRRYTTIVIITNFKSVSFYKKRGGGSFDKRKAQKLEAERIQKSAKVERERDAYRCNGETFTT